MGLVLVTPPAVEPVTVSEARSWLGLSATSVSDAVLEAFIVAARQTIDGRDGWLGRALITQTWKLILPGFTDCYSNSVIRLPLPPTQSVSGIVLTDADGVETTMDVADYRAIQNGSHTYVESVSSWPTTATRQDAVSITFVAGYGNSALAVPQPIRLAIALAVRDLQSMSERNLFLAREDVPGVLGRQWVVSPAAGEVVKRATNNLLSTYRVYSL